LPGRVSVYRFSSPLENGHQFDLPVKVEFGVPDRYELVVIRGRARTR
jgi:hypothetical protein